LFFDPAYRALPSEPDDLSSGVLFDASHAPYRKDWAGSSTDDFFCDAAEHQPPYSAAAMRGHDD
jgi:hypothetical protein